ncbi:hypothetical protein F961_03250 [Acinetobacter baumannii NIPH 60]|nr:hypothetical protein F961_03250 [Acinetobacter baumannii NIPH 60]
MDLNYHKNLQYWLESIVVESQCETNQYHNHNEQSDALVNALKVLLLFGKLRKNFLHFQCIKKDDEQQIANFIAGIEPIIGDHLNLDKQNYPVNLEVLERTVKFSFQRVVGHNKKNVTLLVIFNLMLKIMQEDELWLK